LYDHDERVRFVFLFVARQRFQGIQWQVVQPVLIPGSGSSGSEQGAGERGRGSGCFMKSKREILHPEIKRSRGDNRSPEI
jgi:hypothetical protein